MSRSERSETERLLRAKLRELSRHDQRDGIAINRAPDELDEVQQANDRELALLDIERRDGLAQQIRLALQRLASGEYETCVCCGKQIGSRRLVAVPWTSMCLGCQTSAELARHAETSLSQMDEREVLERQNGS